MMAKTRMRIRPTSSVARWDLGSNHVLSGPFTNALQYHSFLAATDGIADVFTDQVDAIRMDKEGYLAGFRIALPSAPMVATSADMPENGNGGGVADPAISFEFARYVKEAGSSRYYPDEDKVVALVGNPSHPRLISLADNFSFIAEDDVIIGWELGRASRHATYGFSDRIGCQVERDLPGYLDKLIRISLHGAGLDEEGGDLHVDTLRQLEFLSGLVSERKASFSSPQLEAIARTARDLLDIHFPGGMGRPLES